MPLPPPITARTLRPDEMSRLAEAGGPMHGYPSPETLAGSTKIVVLEREGAIVGYWVVADTVHIEPLWLDPSVRHHPRAAMDLLQQVYTELQNAGVGSVYAIIDEGNLEQMGPLARRVGLTEVPGRIFAGQVPAKG